MGIDPPLVGVVTQLWGCGGTNRHDVQERKSPAAKVSPTTLAMSDRRAFANGVHEVLTGERAGRIESPEWGHCWVPTRSSEAAGNSGDSVMAKCPRTWRSRSHRAPYAGSREHRGRHQRGLDESAAETAIRVNLDFGQFARFTGLETTAGLEQAAMVGQTRRTIDLTAWCFFPPG